MSWRDRRRPASFRGVPFEVSEAEALVGRRGVVHEFPGRDEPTSQDLGKRARRFVVSAFVIGEDYDLARDRLIEAVELPGPGLLVHPYYGQIRATVDPEVPVSIRESRDTGGEAVISIAFVREGEQPTPTIAVDTVARANATNARANLAMSNSFVASVDTSGPEGVRTNLITSVTSALGFCGRMNTRANASLSVVDRASAQIRRVTSDVAALILTPNRLITDLIELHDSIFAGLSRVTYATTSVSIRGRDIARALLGAHREAQSMSAATAGLTAADEDTTVGAKQARNQRAVIQAIKVGATIAAAQAATKLVYDSHETAVAVGDELSAAIEGHIGDVDDDVLAGALLDLQVVLRLHMKDVAARLPRIVTYTPATALPACVIAYQVYGSLDREDDIIARNNVSHPGFCRGGEPLKLVSPHA